MLWPRYQLPVDSPVTARAVAEAWRGALTGAGRSRMQLVETLQSFFAAADVLLTDSGTSALALALRATARGRPSAAVALPAYGCYDLATAALAAGVRAVLYDVDPDTLWPDAPSLRRALAHKPCAVVVVHAYGIPVDVAKIAAMVGSEVALIEDAAQGIGATIRGRPAGGASPLGVLSFGRGKGVTGGSGGALIITGACSDISKEWLTSMIWRRRRGIPDALQISAHWALARPGWYGALVAMPWLHLGETRFRRPREWRACSEAAVAAVAAAWNAAVSSATRRSNAARLLAAVRTAGAWRAVSVAEGTQPGYLRLPVVLDRDVDAVVDEQAKHIGVMRGYPHTLKELRPFAGLVLNAGDLFPGAQLLSSRLATLPTHARLEDRDIGALERWVRQAGLRQAANRGSAASWTV